jgi:hypothetical protein
MRAAASSQNGGPSAGIEASGRILYGSKPSGDDEAGRQPRHPKLPESNAYISDIMTAFASVVVHSCCAVLEYSSCSETGGDLCSHRHFPLISHRGQCGPPAHPKTPARPQDHNSQVEFMSDQTILRRRIQFTRPIPKPPSNRAPGTGTLIGVPSVLASA